MTTPHTLPAMTLQAFNCPLCNAYARVTWAVLGKSFLTQKGLRGLPALPSDTDTATSAFMPMQGYYASVCTHCYRSLIWYQNSIVHPHADVVGPPPAGDMPEDIKTDYEEARAILGKSHRGAAALLRLCVQKLCMALGEKGENLNADIGSLVKKGLAVEVQQALDTLRVIGNNAVHPGELDLKDDRATAEGLMHLLNYVVDAMITQPKRRKALFSMVPSGAKEAIAKRDGEAPKK